MGTAPQDLDELIRIVENAGGIHCRDLPQDAELLLRVGGQTVVFSIHKPDTGVALFSSRGEQWAIWTHLTKNWGCTAGPNATSIKYHWLARGCLLCVGPFVFPAVEHIVYRGLDLTAPAASQLQ